MPTVIKMNPELKRKWINALRSGQYPQGRDHLQTSRGYCCLGVLCDISGTGEWDRDADATGAYFFAPYDGTEAVEAYLPFGLADELKTAEGDNDGAIEEHLSQMNDDGLSFAEIADWIEANL